MRPLRFFVLFAMLGLPVEAWCSSLCTDFTVPAFFSDPSQGIPYFKVRYLHGYSISCQIFLPPIDQLYRPNKSPRCSVRGFCEFRHPKTHDLCQTAIYL